MKLLMNQCFIFKCWISYSISEVDGKYYPIPTGVLNPTSNSVNIMENGTLSINGINKEHEGIYQCSVSNEVGPSLQKSASLRVIGENV